MSHPKSCTHIKVTGIRCGSPALRGEQFCYFHQRMLRSVRFPNSRVLRSALLEDPESIQAALMEVVNGLLRGTLELKRGELVLRALNTAVRNIRQARFDLHQEEMIREIPNYPDPPIEPADEAPAAPIRRPTREEMARDRAAMLAEYFGGEDKVPASYKTQSPATAQSRVATDAFVRPPNVGTNGADHVGKDHVGTAAAGTNVGTAAPGCPGGPEVPGRSVVPPKPTKPTPPEANRKPPVSVKREAPSVKAQAANVRLEARSVQAAAPKERKIAAHRASGGRRGRN